MKCNLLVESAVAKSEVKVSKIDEKVTDHDKRITTLEIMADDYEQSKRGNNIIVRGLQPKTNPKEGVVNMIVAGLGIHATEADIKYSIKIDLKNEKPGTESMRVAFFDQKMRDDVYARRTTLKGTQVYISEDLTMKRSSLAFEARQHARNFPNCTTWTLQGTIFMKDSIDSKPRVIHRIEDLEPANAAQATSPRTY